MEHVREGCEQVSSAELTYLRALAADATSERDAAVRAAEDKIRLEFAQRKSDDATGLVQANTQLVEGSARDRQRYDDSCTEREKLLAEVRRLGGELAAKDLQLADIQRGTAETAARIAEAQEATKRAQIEATSSDKRNGLVSSSLKDLWSNLPVIVAGARARGMTQGPAALPMVDGNPAAPSVPPVVVTEHRIREWRAVLVRSLNSVSDRNLAELRAHVARELAARQSTGTIPDWMAPTLEELTATPSGGDESPPLIAVLVQLTLAGLVAPATQQQTPATEAPAAS